MHNIRNVSPDRASDDDLGFPEEMRSYRRHSADPRRIWDYLELLMSMLFECFNGKYPIPIKTFVIFTFSLLYLISPIDIIPELLPVIGFADDIAVLIFASKLIKDDLEDYRVWKMSITGGEFVDQ
jgi:uncharacterized membrane protein YkvA (DUF1232 family)